jgi:hypothetical protein
MHYGVGMDSVMALSRGVAATQMKELTCYKRKALRIMA